MATLTKKEILTQLDKLGVSAASELNTFFKEYEEYSTLDDTHQHTNKEYHEGSEDH